MPFIQALGFDVFDPLTVIPEFTADHGIKKGEKVDYAISLNGEIAILIECKTFGTNLSTVGASQLYRYFSVTNARISILTNGTQYLFFSDLDTPNKMDDKPFFKFDLLRFTEASLKELRKFCIDRFVISEILATANDLKYFNLLKAELARELDNPTDEIVELFARRVYSGRLTGAVREWMKNIFAQAALETVRDRINERLSAAITRADAPPAPATDTQQPEAKSLDPEVVTTPDEIEAYLIIKAILRSKISPERIFMRDAKTYCSIILDNNNRKPIARLYFDKKQKQIGIFDKEKNEARFLIDRLDDLFLHADALMAAVPA